MKQKNAPDAAETAQEPLAKKTADRRQVLKGAVGAAAAGLAGLVAGPLSARTAVSATGVSVTPLPGPVQVYPYQPIAKSLSAKVIPYHNRYYVEFMYKVKATPQLYLEVQELTRVEPVLAMVPFEGTSGKLMFEVSPFWLPDNSNYLALVVDENRNIQSGYPKPTFSTPAYPILF